MLLLVAFSLFNKMETYEFSGVLYGNINHHLGYVHSNIKYDGYVSIVARNEIDDRVPVSLSRFLD